MNKDFILYVRNFIFGAEDSLVSTVGLLSGIVSAGVMQKEVVISGLVLIFVEAFSMSMGSFLSERTTEESYSNFKINKSKSVPAAFIMFLSYLFSGFIPLSPYLIIQDSQALAWSILASLLALFILGLVSAGILKTNISKSAFRMVVIGGFAICLGVVVGVIIK
ncbi:MAG: VIT1/CCC1 transporter family protein [Patescibacteria group bacterium]